MRNYVTTLDSIIARHRKNPEDIHVIVGLDIAKNVFQVHAVDFDTGLCLTNEPRSNQNGSQSPLRLTGEVKPQALFPTDKRCISRTSSLWQCCAVSQKETT